MLKLEVLPLLFAVLTLAAAQGSTPTVGPFHSAVDDFGQVYYATVANPTSPIPLGPFQTYGYPASNSVPAITVPASTLVFVGSNSGRYTEANPGYLILSSDPASPSPPPPPPFVVTDSSWFCKGFGPTTGVYQADWPKANNANSLIVAALSGSPPAYTQWSKAVELFIFYVIEGIPLEARYIWAAGAEPGYPENPPRNVICVKSLASSI